MAVSLGLNLLGGIFIIVGGWAKPAPKPRAAEAGNRQMSPHPPPSPKTVSGDGLSDSSRLLQAGLTVEETRGVLVAAVKKRFRQEADDLMRVVDPALTCDEIFAEGEKRFAKLYEAEQKRRKAIESITHMPWAEFEVQSAWSQRLLFYSYAAFAAGGKERILGVDAALAVGTSDASFAKHDPFGITRSANVGAVSEILNSLEATLKHLLPGTAYIEYCKPFFSSDLQDVWDFEERFGSKLTDDQEDQILALLLPEHPLEHTVGYGESHAGRTIAPEALPEIRKIVGDDTFGNLLKFQSPELSWSAGTHVEVFAIEERYKHEIASGARPDELKESSRLQLAARLGSEFEQYAATSRGAWLRPEGPR